jgi:hypothetical protein
MDHLLLNERPHPYRPDESPLIGDLTFDFSRKEEIAKYVIIMGLIVEFSQGGISCRIGLRTNFLEDRLNKDPTSDTIMSAQRSSAPTKSV